MSSLILVRHCEAAGQEPDAPLTAAGHRQAEQLAGFLSALPVDAISASAYLRARQTAQPLADLLRLSVQVDPRLNERILSPCPIVNWREVVRDSFADLDLRAPGGESANDVLGRAWPALILHSIDPGFGYAGWEKLSNPDVYRVEVGGDDVMSFRRLWGLSSIH